MTRKKTSWSLSGHPSPLLARPAPFSIAVDVKSHVPEIANVTRQIAIAHHCAFAKARAVTMTLEQLLLH